MSLDTGDAFARPGVSPDAEGAAPLGGSDRDAEGVPAADAPDLRGKGRLLEMPDQRAVCRAVTKLWTSQDARMRPILAQWRANELTMDGVPGVRAVKDPDSDAYMARIPFGASAVRVGISKARELGHKTTATLLVDPPQPDVQPSPDDDDDRAKAELSTRILKNECTESGIDLHLRLEDAEDLAATYASGFLLLEMDPAGGGWVPLAIDAHPAAAVYDPAQPEAVLTHPDPEAAAAEDALAEDARPGLVRKFVAKTSAGAPGAAETVGEEADAGAAPTDGPVPLTDDPTEAAVRWQLKLRARVFTGRQVRFLPALARGIEDANGVVVADVTEFGTLRGLFPVIDTWPPERQKTLMTWRPVELKDVLPPDYTLDGDGMATVADSEDRRAGLPADDALCLYFRVFYRSHPAYPDGAEILVAGGDAVLYRGTQCVWVEDPDGGPARPECLDVPVVQVTRYRRRTGGNPYGVADAELLAPGDDLRAQLLVDAVESLWRVNHPHLLLPLGSVIEAGRLGDRDDTPILYNPATGGPQWEAPPGMDVNTLPLYELMGREMDSRSGLEDAQRLNAPNITSGKQANAVIEQSLTTLSPLNRNLQSAFVRACRIILQRFRAYATTPMLLRYTGDDGRYMVREFVGTDLGSARDIRIAAGTSTMLSQSAKQALAMQDFEIALKAQDFDGGYRRYRQAMAANLDPTLGRDQDPHHHRVLRQIHAWREGPPKGEEAPPVAPPPPPQPDPMTGQLVQPPPVDPMQTPDPRALAIFQPLPVDAQPDVARTRMAALGDELARETTERKPRPWVLALAAVYEQARVAAGVGTVAEQQQAAQQQAAQQQQAQAQQAAAKERGDARKLDATAQQKEADRSAALQRTQMQAAARGPTGPPDGGLVA